MKELDNKTLNTWKSKNETTQLNSNKLQQFFKQGKAEGLEMLNYSHYTRREKGEKNPDF